MDNLSKVKNFIEECKQYQHYQFLKPVPDYFVGWEGHPRVKRDYCKWIMSESNCPTLLLDIKFPHEEVAKEAEALLDRYIKHRGDIHPGWASIAVHGQGSGIAQGCPRIQMWPWCPESSDFFLKILARRQLTTGKQDPI